MTNDDGSAEPSALAVDAPALERASIRRNLAHMGSAQAITWAMALVLTVVVPRYLGPENTGVLQLGASLWAIGGIVVALGTATYLQLEVARDPQKGLRLLGAVMVARTAAFVLVAAALVGFATLSDASSTLVVILVILGVAMLVEAWRDALNAAFVGMERMAAPAMLAITSKVVRVVGTLGVIIVGRGVFGVAAMSVVTAVAGLLYIGIKYAAVGKITVTNLRATLPAVVAGGAAFMMVDLANTAYRQTDVIIIAQIAGSRDVGWYAAADILCASLLFPATIVLSTVFPTFGRLHHHDPAGLRSLVQRSFALLVLAAVPIGFGMAMIGPNLADVLFGSEYSGTGQLLTIMSPITVLTFATTLISQVALATGRGRFWTVLLFAAAGLTIPLDLVLVPWAVDRFDNGGIGGAVAYVITESLQFVIGLAVITPYLLNRTSAWRTTRVLIAGAVMCLAVWPLRDMFLAIPVLVGAIAFGVAVIVLRVLDDYQRDLIRSTVARVGLGRRRASSD